MVSRLLFCLLSDYYRVLLTLLLKSYCNLCELLFLLSRASSSASLTLTNELRNYHQFQRILLFLYWVFVPAPLRLNLD